MVTRVDKYLGGLGIDATGKFEIASNATITVGDGLTTGNVVSGTIYSNGVELRANDYATLLSARSNDYSTYTALLTAYSANDGSTLLSALSNDYSTYTTLSNSINAITNLPVTFQSDVTIRGNLYLTGSNTLLVSNTISLGDSLLSLASNNTINDVIDIGVYGHYWNGSANSHAGLIRSAVSKDWMLFGNYTIDLEGNNTINIAAPSFGYANLRLNTANAISVYSNGVELRANDYSTYTTLAANDSATLLSARSNDYSTYTTLDTAKANIASPTFSGTVTLGSNTAVKITGGAANASIRTDGSGNLSWISPLIPRVLTSTANSGTPSLDTDLYDMMVITGQSVAITSFTLTGTPVNGQKLWLSITGTTAIALTGISAGASFEASTVALPTTTVTTNRLDIGFVYNSTTSKWRCVASA